PVAARTGLVPRAGAEEDHRSELLPEPCLQRLHHLVRNTASRNKLLHRFALSLSALLILPGRPRLDASGTARPTFAEALAAVAHNTRGGGGGSRRSPPCARRNRPSRRGPASSTDAAT